MRKRLEAGAGDNSVATACAKFFSFRTLALLHEASNRHEGTGGDTHGRYPSHDRLAPRKGNNQCPGAVTSGVVARGGRRPDAEMFGIAVL